ncbi:ribonuclease T1 [Cerioporus squamosus]|nr:ribonuclease T1 [Cerioporus squamosus]
MKFSFTSAIVSTVLIVAGLADPGSAQSCRCGLVRTATNYNSAQISSAVSTGQSSSVSGYPHQFRNLERLAFPTCLGATLYEYPILTSGPYRGGSPGADRVVYTSTGQFCGCITHTGAPTRKGFVPCVFTV